MILFGRKRLNKQKEYINIAVLAANEQKLHADYVRGKIFKGLCIFAVLFGIISLAALLIYIFWDSVGSLDWQFLTTSPSRFPEKAGIYPMLIGSFMLVAFVALFSLPLGVGAALYLEEYAKQNFLKRTIELNIANLAGVPSIVYGLLGMGLFITALGMQHGTIIVGAFTLTLRVLPIVIVSSQEAIRAVPQSHRNASLGIGVTKWQMVRTVVLPEAVPGIMTGTILALANAMGETAPLIMIGAATSIFTAPSGPGSAFSALPLQIFAWSDFPGDGFRHGVTPAAIVVLLAVLLMLNGIAIFIRYKFSRNRYNS
ncbi:MAG: phosphate ABC transporter permease PstA [Spirochaetia bacterium]